MHSRTHLPQNDLIWNIVEMDSPYELEDVDAADAEADIAGTGNARSTARPLAGLHICARNRALQCLRRTVEPLGGGETRTVCCCDGIHDKVDPTSRWRPGPQAGGPRSSGGRGVMTEGLRRLGDAVRSRAPLGKVRAARSHSALPRAFDDKRCYEQA